MRVHRAYAWGAALGYLGDVLLGDPRAGHPVAVFGRGAAAAERVLWRDSRAAGALHTALCVGVPAAAAALLTRAPRRRGPAAPGVTAHALAGIPAHAAATWTVLGGNGLCAAARSVQAALDAGDVDGARLLLPRLCGRDPQSLDADGIARAAVESVAENTSDAVVGALVWGALAGVPGMAAFRAVNTLDAMVGHLSPRHRKFGWAAAKLDDAAGWPGARLTSALAALAGPRPRGALRAWRSDAHRHPSPNAGPVEAAFAGALGVRLGGTLSYGGRTEHRPVLNSPGRAVRSGDITRAVRLSRRVGLLSLALTTAAGVAGRMAAARFCSRAGSRTGTGGTAT
ncbi:cobalamin biosynthesis protein CobD [Streptomyces daqingensis]|uniref:Cobalamin biosynthesis protein CobD n=1 Tax=Streptomyces daqingensis TaxID=1472640 RepID=A0ABQ2MH62_9ACTN|nr:cobalamin biosynthesis protein [Streptomyces daqingensis]GGO51687.1 cobalamin biosynthesis protein CobD [Streptomyces daqingensis]